jgi:uncharacterized protein (TIGR00251 family)
MNEIPHYPWLRSDNGGQRFTLTLYVQPSAKRTQAVGLHGDALKIKLAAAPVEGAANAALAEYLADTFGVPIRQVMLKQGARSRRKVIEISQPVHEPEALFKQTAK